MNKKTIAATDFQWKTYSKPRIKVAEIEGADIICTSPTASAFSVKANNFEEEEDW